MIVFMGQSEVSQLALSQLALSCSFPSNTDHRRVAPSQVSQKTFLQPRKTAGSRDEFSSLALQYQLNPKRQLANQVELICVVLHCLTTPQPLSN